jgi:hypothetical protein
MLNDAVGDLFTFEQQYKSLLDLGSTQGVGQLESERRWGLLTVPRVAQYVIDAIASLDDESAAVTIAFFCDVAYDECNCN